MVEPIGEMLGVDRVVATRMVTADGRYTGEIEFYAYGENKAEAMRAAGRGEGGYDLADCYAYSDSITDLPMLSAVGHPTAVNPDRALRKAALERGWPVRSSPGPVSCGRRFAARRRRWSPARPWAWARPSSVWPGTPGTGRCAPSGLARRGLPAPSARGGAAAPERPAPISAEPVAHLLEALAQAVGEGPRARHRPNARAAAVSAACSSGGEVDIGRGGVELELLDAGRARDDDDPRQAEQPGQRDLRRLGVVGVGDLAQDVEQRLDPAQVLGAEQRVDRPHPARAVVHAVPAAEQALGQRAVGDDDPVLALGERHQVLQRAGVGQRELHLVADHRPAERRRRPARQRSSE